MYKPASDWQSRSPFKIDAKDDTVSINCYVPARHGCSSHVAGGMNLPLLCLNCQSTLDYDYAMTRRNTRNLSYRCQSFQTEVKYEPSSTFS